MIHAQMTIQEILGMFPNKAHKLSHAITSAGLHCVGCHAAAWETLEVGMRGHGKTQEEIDHLVHVLNELLQEEESNPDTITLTPKAAQKFLKFAEEEKKLGWALRLDDAMAGCSGFEYILDFSEKPSDEDQIFHSEGIDIHVNKNKAPRLLGSIIDYVDGIHSTGFKVENPNVKASCGCGSSHNY
ncbi:MAG: iron-sulfur cluster assembly accessory protein [Chlamydiia bacterium]|nr:iron-sulfur cluster assembly accessory protein [Chlamydiia bacterium]